MLRSSSKVAVRDQGELNIKCDAKFYVKLAARGKANSRHT